ncbi:ArsA family ATPase [Spirulina sp. CS-785/01]|uniref:Get3/ArsA fold putative tail anchor-mediating ATPase NosAFP n=1 Tax=Spirulina sp. CS-785/01 TaxID=3021716 RepID=UPI00232F860F|nr:ArsA family ATPase [Spirulina sp. CS-785/01]MDB9313746.1 ArsA family ATPase [Spirulina sp. CS-785/01]
MAHLITFLGKGGVGRTTVAIAAAKKLAQNGDRVLLATQDPTPAFSVQLGVPVTPDPTEIAPNLSVVQFQSPVMLEKGWEEVKSLEAQYLRSPTLKNVYGQELAVFPGIETALSFYEIRNFNASFKYDVIIYDGAGDLSTLKGFGIPGSANWYLRRFRQVILESDLGKALAPFVQPITNAIFNRSWSLENFAEEPTDEIRSLLQEGEKAIADPKRVLAYLITDDSPMAIAKAQYLWGSAQQVGVSVGGVLWNKTNSPSAQSSEFSPLPIIPLPPWQGDDWQPLMDALPNLRNVGDIPKPIEIDSPSRQVKVFLPGFSKQQVKLTQYGPELTIEAGDQRRNLILPPPFTGQPVKGAKFQKPYLIISL